MKVGSLFSGIGGIELGFERQGFKTEWFIENEPYAVSILKKRFPETPIYGDITKIDFSQVPRVDILTGGFPCQDISHAGKRKGIEGSRSSLWKNYLEAIRILRPKFAIIENVSALVVRGLDVVLTDLASIGYDAEWYNIPASSIGAPHRRNRIFIIAYPNLLRLDAPRPHKCIKKTSRTEKTEWCNYWKFAQVRHKNNYGGTINRYQRIESRVPRVVNGVSNRVDRIRCLGNAVVPQIAEVIAEAIKEVTGEY